MSWKFRLFFLLRNFEYVKVFRLNSKEQEHSYFRNQVLVEKNGNIHKDSIEVFKFMKNSNELKELKQILYKSKKADVFAPCIPIYRDSIVFYDKNNNVKGVLNICFDCLFLVNENRASLSPDLNTFIKLSEFLVYNEGKYNE